jgi:hypothetical protein
VKETNVSAPLLIITSAGKEIHDYIDKKSKTLVLLKSWMVTVKTFENEKQDISYVIHKLVAD